MALEKTLEVLPSLVVKEAKDYQDLEQIKAAIRTSVMSKQYGKEDYITELVCKACTSILPPKSTTFNVDNVRICKILGSGLQSSQVKNFIFIQSFHLDLKQISNN